VFYAPFSGTSAATPHVAGAVGWAYSLPCTTLVNDAKTDPAACVLRVRDLILENVQPNASLKGITTTEGTLDLERMLAASRKHCGGTVGELAILEINPTVTSGEGIKVYYETPNFIPYTLRVVDILGRILFEKRVSPPQFAEKTFFIETGSLAAGTYFVVIQNRVNGVVAKAFVRM
jgi:hypothetical protein